MKMIVPCGLHLILAHHRYMWSYMFDIVLNRKQENIVPIALQKIGCHFLALQIESYFKWSVILTCNALTLLYIKYH